MNELAMKKIALFGCTCLLVAHFVKDGWRGGVKRGDGRGDANDPFAALAMDDDPFDAASKETAKEGRHTFGARKSAALLAARCAMAALFFFVGLAQIKRIVARDFALFVRQSSDAGSRSSGGVPRRPATTTGSCSSLRSRRRSRPGGGDTS